MPYIKQEARKAIEDPLAEADVAIASPGELNFAITTLCKKYLDKHGINYTKLNEVVGVLECAKLELYRRRVVSYEDLKIKENGDVYDVPK